MSRTSSPPAAPPAPPEGSTGGLQVARKGNSDRAKSPPGGPPRAHGAPPITSPVRNAGIDVTEVADEALGQHLSRSVLHFARGGRRDGEAAGTGRPPGRAGRRDGQASGTGRQAGRAGKRISRLGREHRGRHQRRKEPRFHTARDERITWSPRTRRFSRCATRGRAADRSCEPFPEHSLPARRARVWRHPAPAGARCAPAAGG